MGPAFLFVRAWGIKGAMSLSFEKSPADAGDTIFALATPPGVAALALIRISGPQVRAVLTALLPGGPPPARLATYTPILHPETREVIDSGVVTFFAGPASATGEDTAEFSVHGSRAVIGGMFEVLGRAKGCRLAEPGEFTRRAFLNGKIDLTQAEAVADLIHAETTLQRRQAVAQLGGVLRDLYEGWRADLIHAGAYIEAHLDFADEEDIPRDIMGMVGPILTRLQTEISAHLSDDRVGERLRDGFQVVILGPPNAGKSTLLNALCARPAAIVSHQAGTTRDIIDVHVDVGGYPVIVSDTAGLRAEGDDAIEAEGMRRARARAGGADIKLVVLDAADFIAGMPHPDLDPFMDDSTILVLNKMDMCMASAADLSLQARARYPRLADVLAVSLQADPGGAAVKEALESYLQKLGGGHEGASLSRVRHRQALESVLVALTRAALAPAPELQAEDLRAAAASLGRITGRIDVEDMLDVIFRDFCIGK